jgi:hypothetical protein
MSPAGIVMPPVPTGVSDPAALQDVQNKKKQLEQLVTSRKSGRNLADGSQITVEGTAVFGAVPEQPEPSSNWWLQFEKHQPPSTQIPPLPQVTLWPIPEQNWSGWADLGGGITDLSAALNHDGRIEVFAIGIGKELFHIWQTTQ